MTAGTAAPVAEPSLQQALSSRSLPPWAPVAAGALAVLLSATLAAVGFSTGPVRVVAMAGLLFVVLLSTVSFLAEGRRRAVDRFATTLVTASFALALVPLVSVIVVVVRRGAARFDFTFFNNSQRNILPTDPGGGAYHAIVGTAEQVALASLFAIPVGVLVAIYLVEYGGRSRFAKGVSYFVDVMTGLPSIVAGLFVLALWIIALGQGFSGLAGSFALALLQLPVVVKSAEEMLKLVPASLREASYALGVPRWRTVLKVVIPTALPGMITGVMLSIARVTGETAPIVLLTFGNASINRNPFSGAQASLPLFVYQQAGSGNPTAITRAWTGALALILIVGLLNIVARVIARFTGAKR